MEQVKIQAMCVQQMNQEVICEELVGVSEKPPRPTLVRRTWILGHLGDPRMFNPEKVGVYPISGRFLVLQDLVSEEWQITQVLMESLRNSYKFSPVETNLLCSPSTARLVLNLETKQPYWCANCKDALLDRSLLNYPDDLCITCYHGRVDSLNPGY